MKPLALLFLLLTCSSASDSLATRADSLQRVVDSLRAVVPVVQERLISDEDAYFLSHSNLWKVRHKKHKDDE